MLAKLVEGVDPPTHTEDDTPFLPRCLPVKGALQCIEEFPKFSSECIDQFIHRRDVNFDEIEKHWVKNPLMFDDEDEEEASQTVTETEIG